MTEFVDTFDYCTGDLLFNSAQASQNRGHAAVSGNASLASRPVAAV